MENALAISNLQEFFVFVERGPSYRVFREPNQVNLTRPYLKIGVFGRFLPFPTTKPPLASPNLLPQMHHTPRKAGKLELWGYLAYELSYWPPAQPERC